MQLWKKSFTVLSLRSALPGDTSDYNEEKRSAARMQNKVVVE